MKSATLTVIALMLYSITLSFVLEVLFVALILRDFSNPMELVSNHLGIGATLAVGGVMASAITTLVLNLWSRKIVALNGRQLTLAAVSGPATVLIPGIVILGLTMSNYGILLALSASIFGFLGYLLILRAIAASG